MKQSAIFHPIARCVGTFLLAAGSVMGAGLTVEPVAPVSVSGTTVFTLPSVRASNSGTGTLRFLNENAAAAQVSIALLNNDGTNSNSEVFTLSSASQQFTVGGHWQGVDGDKEITINFSPPTTGLHEAILKVTCNPGGATQNYSLKGTGTEPQIIVKNHQGSPLDYNPTTYPVVNLGNSTVFITAASDFTIENAGDYPLTITGITISPPNSDFTVSAIPTMVAADGAENFTVTFTPSATGPRTATLEIIHDDAGKSPFQVTLSAIGNGPRIIVKDHSDTTLNYSPTTYPEVNLGSVSGATDFTFAIENSGDEVLNVTGITTTGADNSDFVVSNAPDSVSAGASENFTVTFTPNATGQRTTTLQITHDDSDETPFRIKLTGSAKNPQIIVKNPDNNSLTYDASTYPDVNLGNSNLNSSASHTFTIENSGDQSLNITAITTTGGDSSEFVVGAIPASVSAASSETNNGSSTFTVTFTPNATGQRTTTLQITHDDSDESPFRITLVASGTRAAYTGTGVDLVGVLTTIPPGDVRVEISSDPEFLPTVDTYAGTNSAGNTDGSRLSAHFSKPSSVAADNSGNLFIADTVNNQIRMINSSGEVTTIAGAPGVEGYGFVNGSGYLARFQFPAAVAVDSIGNVYVADTFNHSIRKLTGTPGGAWTVTTLAGSGVPGFIDGAGSSARFNLPQGLAIDNSGNVYVADTENHRIRLISPAGRVSTVAGTGTSGNTDGNAAVAKFSSPVGLALDDQDNLYVADSGNHKIRMIDRSVDVISTIAGNGNSGLVDSNQFNWPTGLVLANNDTIYVADKLNHAIRQLTRNGSSWSLTTLAGTGSSGYTDGLKISAQFHCPTGLTLDTSGNLIVGDGENNVLRRITLQNISSTASANGTTVSTSLDAGTLGINSYTNYYVRWVDDSSQVLATTHPHISFRIVDLPEVRNLQASTIENTEATVSAEVNPSQSETTVKFEISTDPKLLPPLRVDTVPGVTGKPRGIAVDQNGNRYVADQLRNKIWKIDASNGTVTTLAGTGLAGFADGQNAQFDHPSGIAIDDSGNLYVADTNNHRIRKIDTSSGTVTTIAGSGVAGFQDHQTNAASGKLLYPSAVAVNSDGTKLYVADKDNHRIRFIALDTPATISTLAGTGTAGFADGQGQSVAQFNTPTGVTVDSSGNVYIADRENHRIRKVVPSSGVVTTLAGSGAAGFADNTDGQTAEFNQPSDLAIDQHGNLYIADSGNHRLRKMDLSGAVSTVAGAGTAGYADSTTGSLIPPDRTEFNSPSAITVSAGTIYLSDTGNNKVRRIFRDTLPSFNPATSPLTGNTFQAVSTLIPLNLSPGATYHFRAVAENQRGQAQGPITSFTTLTSQEIALVDDSTNLSLTHSQSNQVDFGDTFVGNSVSRDFTIRNNGESDLTVTSITVPTGYTLQTPATLANGAGTITGGQSATITVSLTGFQGGTYSGNLVIDSDAAVSSFTVPLAGTVLDPPTVTTLMATNRTLTSATLRASINPEGTSTTTWFEYSPDPNLAGVNVTTFAGSSAGFAAGPRLSAKFDEPRGLATDADGVIYIADTANNRIRAIDPSGNTRVIAGTGVAGFAEGTAAQAQFDSPTGVVVASDGTLYVTDKDNHRIRSISPAGLVDTLAGTGEGNFTDGVADAARFNYPWGIAMETDDILYVADRDNNRVRKLTRGEDGVWTVGSLTAALSNPLGIAVSTSGEVYVTEDGSHAVRRISNAGSVDTLAGNNATSGFADASGGAARFDSPQGLCLDSSGHILVADTGNHRIRRIAPDRTVTTLAGSGNPGNADGTGGGTGTARFNEPVSVVTTDDNYVIAGERINGTLRRISSTTIVTLVPGSLQGVTAQPVSLSVGNLLPNTAYYFRARAQNSSGTTIGSNIQTFTSRPLTPFENWQVNEFQEDAIDPAVAGPEADPNNDSCVNLIKYAHGIDPHDQNCEGLPVISVNPANTVFSYTRNQSATDLTYTIQESEDQHNWVTVPNATEQYLPLSADQSRPWISPVQVIASIPRRTDTSGNDQDPIPALFHRLVISFKNP